MESEKAKHPSSRCTPVTRTGRYTFPDLDDGTSAKTQRVPAESPLLAAVLALELQQVIREARTPLAANPLTSRV